MIKAPMMALSKGCATVMACFGLGACAVVGPDFHAPASPHPNSFTRASVSAVEQEQPVAEQWWKSYGSQRIDLLVEQALQLNPSIEAGLASLKVAQENINAQRGLFYPMVQASYGYNRQNVGNVLSSPLLSGNPLFNLHTAQLSVGYSPDLWGANRRQMESLEAQAKGQRYQYDAMRLGLISNVVAAVIQERLLKDQISIADESIAVSEEQLTHMRKLKASGYSSGVDVAAQELADAQTRALLPPLKKQLELTRNLIAVLCGHTPDAQEITANAEDTVHEPEALPSMLPSSLVEHRPDIQAAKEQLHAAHAQIGVAVSNMLPQISLTAGMSASNGVLANLFAASNQSWGLFAGVAQPIFNAGTLSARKRAAEAQAEVARAQYQAVVLSAFQNVADTLYAVQEDRNARKSALDMEAANLHLLGHVKQQLELGYVSRLALLNARQMVLQARLSRVIADATVLGDTVSMYLALGGGWAVHQTINK